MSVHTHILISSARTAAGISQAELARRAGIPRSVMNVYERGKREPSAEMLARLLNAAGYCLTVEPLSSPVDPARAGHILEQVIGLAEAYPPLAQAIPSSA
jgi:transcriptional regulator with XRE-family HTH domain